MLPLPRGAVLPLLFLLCAILYINGVQSDGRVVCYYTNWSVYRPGTAKFNPQNINPYLCTHLIYAFGGFTKDNQMKPFDKYQDIEQGGYAKFTGLKTYNKQLKTMIAIGGWNEASTRFSPLVASAERRQKFIKNILKFLRQNHFDGIDLDWEYPAHRTGGRPQDRENYAQFVQELRAEFEREAEKTGRPRLLLTMAVPAGIEYIEKGYDIPKLNKYLDWFNLLTYDFHASTEPSVNHHAPLYSLEEESEYNYDAELNIDYSVKFYLNAGADRDKLVLGIPTYGRSFTLINEESTEIGAPSEGPGEQGDATREKGYLAYYEICQNLKEDPEWTVVQPNPNAVGPYAYRRNQWVGYDDEAIVRKKSQYVVDNGLGGIMFWAIDNDDFRGTCTGKAYPLIEAAKEAMLDALGFGINEVSKPSAPQKPSRARSRENTSSSRNNIEATEHKLTYAERKAAGKRTGGAQATRQRVQQSTTTTTTTVAPKTVRLTEAEGSSLYIGGRTTTPPPPTTPDPGTDFKCEEEGFFQHPRDCKKYYWCLDSGPSGLGIVAHQFTCPSGLYFNPAADSCDFARNVPCKTKKSTTAAPVTAAPTTRTTTTTPRPSRVTAALNRNSLFRTSSTTTTTTTTTTEAPEYQEYEEDEDDTLHLNTGKHGVDKDAEEDPKVIKELIELIRKLGGVEELEKHLLRKDDGTISIKSSSSSSSSSSAPTTPSSISKSLYDKVLSKPNALNSIRNSLRATSSSSFRTKTQTKTVSNVESDEDELVSEESDARNAGSSTSAYNKYSSVVRGGNSRQGPQNEGIDKLAETEGFLKEKKQYITITRNRGSQKSSRSETEAEGEEDVESESEVVGKAEEDELKTTKKSSSGTTLTYSTIRRSRPTTQASTDVDEDEEVVEKDVTEKKQYSSLNRNRSRVSSTTTTEPETSEVTSGSTRYKYLERSRPAKTTTEASRDDDADDDEEDNLDHENTVQVKTDNKSSTQDSSTTTTTTTTTTTSTNNSNTQKTYATIGRRTTTTTSPETETTATETSTTAASEADLSTTTTATTETPITTTTTTSPQSILETTTPTETIVTSHTATTTTPTPSDTPIVHSTTPTTNTNPEITTTTNETPLTSTTTADVTTSHINDISDMDPETVDLSLKINSLMTESSSSVSLNPVTTTESGQDSGRLTTTITSTTTTNSNKQDEADVNDEVNVVIKERQKTVYRTRTRITTTTTAPTTTTTTTNTPTQRPINTRTRTTKTATTPTTTTETPEVDTASSRRPLRTRQQILLNRSSQTKTTTTTTTEVTPTTETVNSEFLGTVSSPRPFGFPKKRTRPTATTTTTTTTEASPASVETKTSVGKSTKLKAAVVNTQIKKLRTPATVYKNGVLVTRRPVLSVRRRLITTTPAPASAATATASEAAAATTAVTTTESSIATTTQSSSAAAITTTAKPLSAIDGDDDADEDDIPTTSKYTRLRFTYLTTTTVSPTTSQDSQTTPLPTTFPKAGNKSKKKQRTENDLSLTPSAANDIGGSAAKQQQQQQQHKSSPSSLGTATTTTTTSFRRKYQARRLTTTTASPTNADGLGSDQPRTQNPLFKRRFSLTTTTMTTGPPTTLPPFNVRTLLPTRLKAGTTIRPTTGGVTVTTDAPLTTIYFDSLDNDEDTDQVAKSSIHTSLFNQINGRLHNDDEDEDDERRGVGVALATTRLINNVQKPTAQSTTSRDPTSRFLQHQQQQQQQQSNQQIYNYRGDQSHHHQQQTNYNLEDVITRRMDGTAGGGGRGSIRASSTTSTLRPTSRYLSSTTPSMATSPKPLLKKRKLIVKQQQKPSKATPISTSDSQKVGSNRRPHKYQEPFNRPNSYDTKAVSKTSSERTSYDYDYYDDDDSRVVGNRKNQQLKVILHGGGLIECLDQGNFPHPLSCRKFISCAKFETGGVVGWEYTCPKGLSYDPVGGMCNWAAGLGCNE